MMADLTIGLNLLYLVPNQVGGTEYYARSLITALQHQDKTNRYVVFCNRENWPTIQLTNPRWQKILCPVAARHRPVRVLFEQLILPLMIRRWKIDVLHSPGYAGLLLTSCPQIITIHDANWRDQPADFSWLNRLLQTWLNELSMAKANLVITDSIFAQQRLLAHFPWLTTKLRVLPPGIDQRWLRLLRQVRSDKPLIDQPYLLLVSAFYPHKRVPYALRLWSQLQSQLPSHQLIVIGQNGGEEKVVRYCSARLPRVQHFPKVSRAELANLYRHAAALLHPSVYEGFGYPVYEAALVGIPIVVGRTQLYDQRLASRLTELSFNCSRDVRLIKHLLQRRTRFRPPSWLLTQSERSITQLINCYQAVG